MASRALRNPRSPGERGFEFPWRARRYGLRTSDRPVSHRRSRITEGHSNDSPTASLRWRRRPASRTSPFPGRGTAAAPEKSTFWVISYTHWEGAVFKTRAGYYPGNQDPHKSLQPIRSSNSRSRLPRDQRSTMESTEIHGKENPNQLPLAVSFPGATPARRVGSFRGYAFVMIFLAVVIPRDGPAQHPERDEALEAAARLPVRPGPRWLT